MEWKLPFYWFFVKNQNSKSTSIVVDEGLCYYAEMNPLPYQIFRFCII
jgi:protein associated with RNAse G/E